MHKKAEIDPQLDTFLYDDNRVNVLPWDILKIMHPLCLDPLGTRKIRSENRPPTRCVMATTAYFSPFLIPSYCCCPPPPTGFFSFLWCFFVVVL